MKINWQQAERIALWVILIILCFVVFFRRVSGFTPMNPVINMMHLKEYNSVSGTIKDNYDAMLTSNAANLSRLTDAGMYQAAVTNIMNAAFKSNTVVMCPPGYYGPPCVACPIGTNCPDLGTKTPLPCPTAKSPGTIICPPA